MFSLLLLKKAHGAMWFPLVSTTFQLDFNELVNTLGWSFASVFLPVPLEVWCIWATVALCLVCGRCIFGIGCAEHSTIHLESCYANSAAQHSHNSISRTGNGICVLQSFCLEDHSNIFKYALWFSMACWDNAGMSWFHVESCCLL